MKIKDIKEERPVQTQSGKFIELVSNADIAPKIMDKFKEHLKSMSPEDKQKIQDMGGVKEFWNNFKQTATYRLDLYRDRGVFTINHPVIGRLEQTVNMRIGNLDNGEVDISGVSARYTNPGHSRTTTQRANADDIARAGDAARAELNRQGIDPRAGMRR